LGRYLGQRHGPSGSVRGRLGDAAGQANEVMGVKRPIPLADVGRSLLPSPVLWGLGAWNLSAGGASTGCSRIVTVRALATPPERGVVGGLRRWDLPSRRHPSYPASTSCRLRTFTLRVHGHLQASHNAAERALRRAVIWRKGSFGTWSADGSAFISRILTVVTTLRQQGRHALDYGHRRLHRRPARPATGLAAAGPRVKQGVNGYSGFSHSP